MRNSQRSSDRSFGLLFGIVFTLIGLWPLWNVNGSLRIWSIAVAAAFFIVAIFCPLLLRPLSNLWALVGAGLHTLMQPLILVVLFFGSVAPIGWLLRRFGKDNLRVHKRPAVQSYWVVRAPPGPAPDTMQNQY